MLREEFQTPEAGMGERAAARLTTRFVLDLCGVMAEVAGGDLLRGLILTAIVDANVGHLAAQESRDHGSMEGIPPDDLRRPISISALARLLKIPYETTRRHVARLLDEGICIRIEDRGVIVPAAMLAQIKPVTAHHYESLRGLLLALNEAGFDVEAMSRPS